MTVALDAPVLDVASGDARSPRERSMVCGVQLLGALTVYPPEGAPLSGSAFGTAKNRALLIMLAWHVDRPVACTTILDALWPEAAPERGRASLRTAASTLRHVIGGHIVREADALVLHDAEVDAIEFQRSAERAGLWFRAGDDVRGLEEADGALRLYRGHLVEDDPLLDPVPGAGDKVRRLWSELRLDSAQASLRLGRYQDAIALATPVAEDDPCL
jgi:two-component SAPR family response regulator